MPRGNPSANYNLWVIMTYRCKFLSYNECTSLVGFLITEKGMFFRSQEVNRKSPYHVSIFVFMEKCCKKIKIKKSWVSLVAQW